MVRDLSLVGPFTVTAEPALLGLARTALRSHSALAVERERQATARLAIWWPGEDPNWLPAPRRTVPGHGAARGRAGMRPAMQDRGMAGEGCCRCQPGA